MTISKYTDEVGMYNLMKLGYTQNQVIKLCTNPQFIELVDMLITDKVKPEDILTTLGILQNTAVDSYKEVKESYNNYVNPNEMPEEGQKILRRMREDR